VLVPVPQISWRARIPAACATGVLYVGMQTVFSLVFSAVVVSDEHTYGPIGTIFALLSYLIAIGVVVILGAVAGRAWHERSPGTSETGHLPLSCRPQLPPHMRVQGPRDGHMPLPIHVRAQIGGLIRKDSNLSRCRWGLTVCPTLAEDRRGDGRAVR
jgi:virulence factor BrkB